MPGAHSHTFPQELRSVGSAELSAVVLGGEEAQGLSGQCWVGSVSSTDSPWKRIGVTAECEVAPASALIWERFENYFMPVSSTDFDNVEGRS